MGGDAGIPLTPALLRLVQCSIRSARRAPKTRRRQRRNDNARLASRFHASGHTFRALRKKLAKRH